MGLDLAAPSDPPSSSPLAQHDHARDEDQKPSKRARVEAPESVRDHYASPAPPTAPSLHDEEIQAAVHDLPPSDGPLQQEERGTLVQA